jgi:hypothetical protein
MPTAVDLLSRAAKDKAFAKEVGENPEKFKKEYQLTDEQLKAISGAMKARGGPTTGGGLGFSYE